MTDLKMKLQDYMRSQCIPVMHFAREVEDFETLFRLQRKDMSEAQEEEAMRIVENFFMDARKIQIVDASYPVVKFISYVPSEFEEEDVLGDIALYAETLISKRFYELDIGNEYNVDVCYLEPTCAENPEVVWGEVIEPGIQGYYRVTIEVEFF